MPVGRFCSLPIQAIGALLLARTLLDAEAQQSWRFPPIPSGNLLDDVWHRIDAIPAGGQATLRITGLNLLQWKWQLRIQFSNGAELSLDTNSVARRKIVPSFPTSTSTYFTVDLPAATQMRAYLDPPNQQINVEISALRVAASSSKPETIITAHPKIVAFDDGDGITEQDRARRLAFGRLLLFHPDGSPANESCSTFRIAPRFWATAGHCVAYEDGHGILGRWEIEPANYRGAAMDRDQQPFAGIPVGTGQRDGVPRMDKRLEAGDLDYAVLRAEADPGGMALPLDGSDDGQSRDAVRLYIDSLNNPYGKALSADQCWIRFVSVGSADECRDQIRHTCSGDGGSSGGPLLRSADLRVVGIHYGLGSAYEFNCALRVTRLRSHFCASHPDIAKEIMQCP